jgi:hypothetical protein
VIERKAAYYGRIAADPDARALKLLDRTDNLCDAFRALDDRHEWACRYLEKTRHEFPPLVEREETRTFASSSWTRSRASREPSRAGKADASSERPDVRVSTSSQGHDR